MAHPVCETGAFVCDGDRVRLCDKCGTGYEDGSVDCGEVGFGCEQGRCCSDPEDRAYFEYAESLEVTLADTARPSMEELLAAKRCHANRRPFRCGNGVDDDRDGEVDLDDPDCRGPEDKDEAALRDRIVSGAGLIGLLSDSAPTLPSAASQTSTREADGYRERLVYLEHPRLGYVEVRLLLPPPSPETVPVILGLHGHGGDAAMFRDDIGASLARSGLAVAAVSFRAMAYDQRETALATRFIEAGGALLGVRVAEAVMVLRWLATVPEVDAARIGLLGHSGGSMAALMAARLYPVKALHLDHTDTFGWDGRLVHGDVAPLLQCSADGVWVFEEINDTTTLGIPIRRGDHSGWGKMTEAERGEIATLFRETL